MMVTARIKDEIFKRKRKAILKKCSDGQLKRFLMASTPNINSKIIDTEFLVADLEMTGLNYKTDKILSIGTTLIKRKSVIHAEARHHLIYRSNTNLTDSAPIHRIFEPDLLEGKQIIEVLNSLLGQLEGRVLVLHHAALDKKFLNTACKKHFGAKLFCLTLDTMHLELTRLQRQGKEAHKLDLANTRQRYSLPAYVAHNAAIDALSTAELFLAQLTYLDPNHHEPLSFLL